MICSAIVLAAFAAETYAVFSINTAACEDAYITFRFSRNLAEGAGPVFNPGDPVEGYSNTVWMAALAAAHSLGIDMAFFSRAAGFFCNFLALLLVWYIPWRYFSCRGIPGLFGPLLYLILYPFHFYATSGLETSLYIMLVLLCLQAALWADDRPLPFTAASACFLVTALTRPDGIIFFACYIIYVGWRAVAGKKRLLPYVPGIVFFAAGYGLFIAWRLHYYGLPLPNTYYAKGSFPLLLRAGLGVLMNKGFVSHYFFLPAAVLAMLGFARFRLSRPLITVLVFLIAGMIFSIGFSGFDWMPYFRYTLPAVPAMIILCQVLFSRLWQDAARTAYRKLAITAAALLFFCFAAEQFWADLSFSVRWNAISEFAMHNQRVFGRWIHAIPGRARPVWAMGDVGRLAFFSRARIVDIFGLASREFASIRSTYGAPQADGPGCAIGFDRYKPHERKELLEQAPDYVMLYNARLKISETFPGSAEGIAGHPDFRQRYTYLDTFYTIPKKEMPSWPELPYPVDVTDLSCGLLAWIRNGWGYDMYIRKDSPYPRFYCETDPGGRLTAIVSDSPAGAQKRGAVE